MVLNAATFVSFTVLNLSYASCSCLKVYDLPDRKVVMVIPAVFRSSDLQQPPKICCFKM